jgi:hypothetical protein
LRELGVTQRLEALDYGYILNLFWAVENIFNQLIAENGMRESFPQFARVAQLLLRHADLPDGMGPSAGIISTHQDSLLRRIWERLGWEWQ